MARIKVKICGKCDGPNDRPAQRWCAECHAGYMRDWRKANPLTGGQRARDTARSYAGEAKRRGNLTPQPCEACNDPHAEMHHQDHERPLEVTWLCRPCHLSWHSFWREISRLAFQQWLAAGVIKRVSNVTRETSTEAA